MGNIILNLKQLEQLAMTQQLCCGQEQVVKLGGVSLDHQTRGEFWRGSESVMISLLQARPETAYWTWQGRRVTA